jgi:hypothetical protein
VVMRRTWRDFLKRLVDRQSTRDHPRTTISDVDWTRPPPGQPVTELTIEEIRANEGDLWEPPPPARRDPWRPLDGHW